MKFYYVAPHIVSSIVVIMALLLPALAILFAGLAYADGSENKQTEKRNKFWAIISTVIGAIVVTQLALAYVSPMFSHELRTTSCSYLDVDKVYCKDSSWYYNVDGTYKNIDGGKWASPDGSVVIFKTPEEALAR